jgi:hypothetical protein
MESIEMMDVSGEVALPQKRPPAGVTLDTATTSTTTTTTTQARRAALDFFAALPPELALYVVSFMRHTELCALAQVCHLCHSLAYYDEVRPRHIVLPLLPCAPQQLVTTTMLMALIVVVAHA